MVHGPFDPPADSCEADRMPPARARPRHRFTLAGWRMAARAYRERDGDLMDRHFCRQSRRLRAESRGGEWLADHCAAPRMRSRAGQPREPCWRSLTGGSLAC